MRKTTTWMMGVGFGLCLAAAACSGSEEEQSPAAANAEPTAPNAAASADPPPAPPSDPSAPSEPTEPAPLADSDAGAPLADAGAEASAPKPKIPAPSQGTLIVTTNTGAMCEWTVGGVVKGTSSQLNTQLYGGTYDVSCKRVSDAKVIAGKASVTGSQTTNLELTFKGKVSATSNVPCAWYFAGFFTGSTGTTYNAEHLPGTSSLECDPTDVTKGSQTKVIQIVADTTTPVTFTLF